MQAKNALDKVIKKSRVHFYKPIQIAEILYHHRTTSIDLADLESYRNLSKKWRDQITQRLIGRVSTSSQKFQDNIFDENALPPHLLNQLGEFNKKTDGAVEAYIYESLHMKLDMVTHVQTYIANSNANTFELKKLLEYFILNPGLKRSVDKMYEITVYALFVTIVRALKATVSIELGNKDTEILRDFETFIKMVLGISLGTEKITKSASLFRVGVTNAADRGLDMIFNFGPVIQVKHLTLTPELAEDITTGLAADCIIIVCLTAEEPAIRTLLTQIGMDNRIQGIITLSDLEKWYTLCLSIKYRTILGNTLLSDLSREFENEFPSSQQMIPFIEERHYNDIQIPKGWDVSEV